MFRACPVSRASHVHRLMRSSWMLVLLLNFVLAVYFVVSGLGFGMWCVPLACQHPAQRIGAAKVWLAKGSKFEALTRAQY